MMAVRRMGVELVTCCQAAARTPGSVTPSRMKAGLFEVDVLVVSGQGVEGHAGLHGGEGVDVVDGVAVAG